MSNDTKLNKIIKNNNIVIPSKFFFAPINTGLAYNGKPNKCFVEFYTKRSGKGIGITYVGNAAIGEKFKTNSNTPFFRDTDKDIWEYLADAIYKKGSLPGIQIACRYSKDNPLKSWGLKNYDKKSFLSKTKETFINISKSEMQRIKNDFLKSCHFSIKAGFKVIQLHAAHGYFLSQLLDYKINKREDIYGIEPIKFIEEIVNFIKEEDENIIVDLRLSLYDGINNKEVEFEHKFNLIKKLSSTNIDLISISNGIYDFDKNYIYPSLKWGHGPFINDSIDLAKDFPDKIFNIAGNIWDIRRIPNNIPNNLTFSIGRALIADPELIIKSHSGLYDKIIWCERKGSCHYYTKGKEKIFCPFDSTLA